MRLAATRADIVSLSGIGRTRPDGSQDTTGFAPGGIDRRIEFVRAATAGREIELQALVQRVILTDDPVGAAEQVRVSLPDLSIDDVLATPYLWIGTPESICEDILAARARWGFSYFTVFNDQLDSVAPIVARLAGE